METLRAIRKDKWNRRKWYKVEKKVAIIYSMVFKKHKNNPVITLTLSSTLCFPIPFPSNPESINDRDPSFLAVKFGSFPLPSSPSVRKLSLFLSLPVCRRSSLLTEEGGGGDVAGAKTTEYISLQEMKQAQCICPLSWSVHCNFTGDGKCNKRGWACTPHPHQPRLILHSWLNVRQKADVTTLCTLWPKHTTARKSSLL